MRILVTGGAGFIGSNLTDALLRKGCEVTVLDNISTGKRENLAHLKGREDFTLMEGDIRSFETCVQAVKGCTYVFHEAALGSVPRSIKDPRTSLEVNVQGFINMMEAARLEGVKRFVYASSSSVYGDQEDLPKVEEKTGNALSPYALSKQMDESVAAIYRKVYSFESVGLRYFNVFGPRQDPNGAYAAVIPKFIGALLRHESPLIHGDGSHSRDFTFVDNVVQANLHAMKAQTPPEVCNVACGSTTTLNELFEILREGLSRKDASIGEILPRYGEPRPGDIPHSHADISRAKEFLDYTVQDGIRPGLEKTIEWYLLHCR